jgi:hypothetical protein
VFRERRIRKRFGNGFGFLRGAKESFLEMGGEFGSWKVDEFLQEEREM